MRSSWLVLLVIIACQCEYAPYLYRDIAVVGETQSGQAGRVAFITPHKKTVGTKTNIDHKVAKEINSPDDSAEFGRSVALDDMELAVRDRDPVTKLGIIHLYHYFVEDPSGDVDARLLGYYWSDHNGVSFHYHAERENCLVTTELSCRPFYHSLKGCDLGLDLDMSDAEIFTSCMDPTDFVGGVCVIPLVPAEYNTSACVPAPPALPCSVAGQNCTDDCIVNCTRQFDHMCNETNWDSECVEVAYDDSQELSCYEVCFLNETRKRSAPARDQDLIRVADHLILREKSKIHRRQTITCEDYDECETCTEGNTDPTVTDKCIWLPEFAVCEPLTNAAVYAGFDIHNDSKHCADEHLLFQQLATSQFFVDPSVMLDFSEVSKVEYHETRSASEPDLLIYDFCLSHPEITVASHVPGVVLCSINDTFRDPQSPTECEYIVIPGALNMCPEALALNEDFIVVGFPKNNSVIVMAVDDIQGDEPGTQWIIALDESDDDTYAEFGSDVFFSEAGGVTTLYVSAKGDPTDNKLGAVYFYRFENTTSANDTLLQGYWKELSTKAPSINYPLGNLLFDVNLLSTDEISMLFSANRDGSRWKFTAFEACPVGQQFISGKCQECPPGQYKSLATIEQCNLCPQGTYNKFSGQNSSAACVACRSDQWCPPGSIVPSDFKQNSDTSNTEVTPELKQTDALQFETTFFVTAWPYILGFLLLLSLLLLVACIPCHARGFRKFQAWILRFYRWFQIGLYYPHADDSEKDKQRIRELAKWRDAIAGCFSLLTAAAMLLVLVFGFIVFSISANEQVAIVLRTQREVAPDELTNWNKVDSPPMQMIVSLVSYSGTPAGSQKPALCNGGDNIRITSSGCTVNSTGQPCTPILDSSKKGANTVNVTYANTTQAGGVRVCKITLDFPVGTKLLSAADFVFEFKDPSFYASHILFNLSTTNDDSNTPTSGNSKLYDYITAPAINNILRKDALLQISTTVNYVEDCFDSLVKTDPDISWLQTTQNNCTFDKRSLKEFSPNSKGLPPAEQIDFYAASDSYVYKLNVRVTKDQYWKHTQLSNYVNIGQVIVWIILFALGLVGIFQIIQAIIAPAVPPLLRIRQKYAPQEKEDKEINLEELKVKDSKIVDGGRFEAPSPTIAAPASSVPIVSSPVPEAANVSATTPPTTTDGTKPDPASNA